MFVAAMDALFAKINPDILTRVKSISASGQQHGTVYWKDGSLKTLEGLDPTQTLKSQLSNSFSKSNSPIWMDSSTEQQCKGIQYIR